MPTHCCLTPNGTVISQWNSTNMMRSCCSPRLTASSEGDHRLKSCDGLLLCQLRPESTREGLLREPLLLCREHTCYILFFAASARLQKLETVYISKGWANLHRSRLGL